jgi:hypothetical protein
MVMGRMLVVVLRRFGRVYHSGEAVKDCLTPEDGNYQQAVRNGTEDGTLDRQLSCGREERGAKELQATIRSSMMYQ